MKFNALLVGPEDTPYEYGMFEFLLKFPNGNSPPTFHFCGALRLTSRLPVKRASVRLGVDKSGLTLVLLL